jgi:hypothetical protein
MGGGSFDPIYALGVSAQSGGRILPATDRMLQRDGLMQVAVGWNGVQYEGFTPDRRPIRQSSALLGGIGGWGGANGQPGAKAGLTAEGAVVVWVDAAGQAQSCASAGGGGWGAKGGDYSNTALGGVWIGGAGGKAIETNGHAVTWTGGSDRAYGAVG